MDLSTLTNWLQAGVRLAAPLVLTSIGSVYNERVGIINISIEGSMLVGALAAVAGTLITGNVVIGTICALAAGGLLAVVHAYLTVARNTSHLVSGLALNFLALGATNMGFALLFPTERARVATYPVLGPPELRSVPFFGPVVFNQAVIVWIALILPFVSSWVLYRTSWGLNIRAVGEDPHAVASAGLSVFWPKFVAVVFSGVCAGLGGSALALTDLGYFAPNMTGGRAFVVLAANVVGKWNPIMVAASCLLYGAADALQLRIQTFGSPIPYQFFLMLPYLVTVAALAGFVGRVAVPKTLGEPYDPEAI